MKKWRCAVPLSATLGLFALGVTRAFARMGGGESFNSGPPSSVGDSNGSDLGIPEMIIDLLWWLLIHEPKVGIPLTLAFIIGFYFWNRQSNGEASTRKAIRQADAQRQGETTVTAVDARVRALQAKDPQFNPTAFLERTRREFITLQEAWFARDLEPVRRYLSDATFQRLTTQLKLMAQLGTRDAIADPQLLDARLVRIEQNAAFDAAHVRITGQMRDCQAPATASDAEAWAIAERESPTPFTEIWTFVRQPGVQTKPGFDLSQGQCPSCGAPFAGGATNTCTFCGAIVNSGTYDWVLAEITQGAQYQAGPKSPSGFSLLRQSDPSLSTEVLEDRASLLFWKWVEAQATGDAGRLAKVAHPAFLTCVQAEIEQLNTRQSRKYFLDCAVGAVNTLAFRQADGRDVAAVEIRWSARTTVAPAGRQPSAPNQPARDVMLLERRHGAQTGNAGMSTNRCPSCAAPLSDNGQPTCEYCGTELSAGDADWVLRDFGSWEWWRTQRSPEAAPDAPDIPDRAERERLVYLMAAMATADGVVDNKERALLRMASERWAIPWANIEPVLGAPTDPNASRPIIPGSPEAETFLRDLLQLARADGKVDAKEKKLLKATAIHLGLMGKLPELLK